MTRSLSLLLVVSSVALILAGCEPWDPFGMAGVSVSEDGNPVAEELPPECRSRYFYNGPNGEVQQLGCDTDVDRAS